MLATTRAPKSASPARATWMMFPAGVGRLPAESHLMHSDCYPTPPSALCPCSKRRAPARPARKRAAREKGATPAVDMDINPEDLLDEEDRKK